MGVLTEWQSTLLLWYEGHKRSLPWRDTSDAYRIWVSEIILQQTRVVQGLAYYERFLKHFPTFSHLAHATEDEVLLVWQGLGYYSRARNMQAAARQIMELGKFPDTYEGIRALKGVGDYTAAAISSFAYGLPHAVVDGNVYRVLSRYYGDPTPIDTSLGKQSFSALAQMLLPEQHAAAYNQALMDFGALQCVPKSPDCRVCPLAGSCVAHAEKAEDKYPVKSHRTKVTKRFLAYLYIETPQGIWLHRRKAGDIWQGLYEFPVLEFSRKPNLQAVLSHPWAKSAFPQGFHVRPMVDNVMHILTHQKLQACCYEVVADIPSATKLPEGCLAVKRSRLDDYAMPKLMQIIKEKVL